ncbi:CRT10-domain-containing protein [Lipomyces arxii]|uniref:CRT10-domain-containing protein n=1 Tax=Lipomyces arxii TaxID=56418 RepID=UPI0034CDED48
MESEFSRSFTFRILVCRRWRVMVFRLASTLRPELELFTQITPPKPNPPTVSQLLGANNPMNLFSINALKIGNLDGEEHVVVLTDAGQAILYSTAAIIRDQERRSGNEKLPPDFTPIYVLQVERSAWGVDMHDAEKLLVVTDNSRTITIFRLGYSNNWEATFERKQKKRQREREMSSDVYSSSAFSSDASESQLPRLRRRKRERSHLLSGGPHIKRARDSLAFRRVIKHADDNNMPSVRFLEIPLRSSSTDVIEVQVCVMTTSIDGDVKVWDINTLRCISNSIFQDKKGWSCLALYKHDFTPVRSINLISGMKEFDEVQNAGSITGMSRYTKDASIILTYPVKSSSPYMTVTKRRRRENCLDGEYPFELYEDPVDAVFDSEITVDATGRHQHYEDSIEDMIPGHARSYATLTSADVHPVVPFEERSKKYNFDDIVLFNSSLYQARLVDFKDGMEHLANICPAVFGKRVPMESFTASFDRLNMSISIPELACILVASQEGQICVCKLCQVESGEIGMKQEYIIREKSSVTSTNILLGMGVVSVTTDGEDLSRRFLLILVYFDGTVATYQLQRASSGAQEDVDNIHDLIF